MECVLEVKGLTKLYKNGRGVKNISFQVEKGDVLGLLGPNGSGKTTIMKVISGLCRKDSGEIKIFEKDAEENFEECMRKIGCLIEAPSIYGYLSAYKNLSMMSRFYDSVGKTEIEKLLETVRLSQYKNDKAGRFSLGMKQRLGLAMALLSEPELIILDEPANGLDIEGMIEIREIITKLAAERGITFLVSSHLANEIEKTCNKVAVIYEGELVSFATMQEALELNPALEDYFLSTVKEKRGNIII
ncbi:MAG: ATP-binding cassette domain-containing protein [Clostridia bacterium]|nr:ATP-binding cassette domain-containing protein [Clostridia bacterium]